MLQRRMTTEQQQKELRDKFVAFSFAASDFLLEIDKKGTILFAAGQVQTLTGQTSEALKGQSWFSQCKMS